MTTKGLDGNSKGPRMSRLILVRHGQSLWNLENRFTGWVDVPLTPLGRDEMRRAASLISDTLVDVAYTSLLTRARDSAEVLLAAAHQTPPVIADGALNERQYGELQGLDKDECGRRYGEEQVKLWRRSWNVAPPGGESLEMTARRAIPFFERAIGGDLRMGKTVLVVAHGNSNRAIVMHLEGLSKDEVVALTLETGSIRIYELDEQLAVRSCKLQ